MSESKLTATIYLASFDCLGITRDYRMTRKEFVANIEMDGAIHPDSKYLHHLIKSLYQDKRFKAIIEVAERSSAIILENAPLFSGVSATYPVSQFDENFEEYLDRIGSSVHVAFSMALRNIKSAHDSFTLPDSVDDDSQDDAELRMLASELYTSWHKPSSLMSFHLQYEINRLVDMYGLPEESQNGQKRVILDEAVNSVQFGERTAYLGGAQFRLFKYLNTQKRATLETLATDVWGGNTSNENIIKCMQRTNSKLEESDLLRTFELKKIKGSITLISNSNTDT